MLKIGRGLRVLCGSVALAVGLSLASAAWAAGRPVVVLDPGHGGADAGITGSYGAREKDMTLALAFEVRRQLGGRVDTHLTRESDRGLSVMRRTELANSFHGDLLISLHAGGGGSRDANRLSLFVQRDRRGPGRHQAGGDGWEGGHRPFVPESQALAAALKRSLAALDGYEGVSFTGVPLRVAKGARMPVVLVEVGNLTNPREEGRLESPEHLRRVAAAVAAGIEAFLSS